MRGEYRLRQCAGFEQGETEDNGIGCKGEYRAVQIVRYYYPVPTTLRKQLLVKTQAIFVRGVHLQPNITVDAQTYEVRVDGELITSEPADVLPMAQRYFLF